MQGRGLRGGTLAPGGPQEAEFGRAQDLWVWHMVWHGHWRSSYRKRAYMLHGRVMAVNFALFSSYSALMTLLPLHAMQVLGDSGNMAQASVHPLCALLYALLCVAALMSACSSVHETLPLPAATSVRLHGHARSCQRSCKPSQTRHMSSDKTNACNHAVLRGLAQSTLYQSQLCHHSCAK